MLVSNAVKYFTSDNLLYDILCFSVHGNTM